MMLLDGKSLSEEDMNGCDEKWFYETFGMSLMEIHEEIRWTEHRGDV